MKILRYETYEQKEQDGGIYTPIVLFTDSVDIGLVFSIYDVEIEDPLGTFIENGGKVSWGKFEPIADFNKESYLGVYHDFDSSGKPCDYEFGISFNYLYVDGEEYDLFFDFDTTVADVILNNTGVKTMREFINIVNDYLEKEVFNFL